MQMPCPTTSTTPPPLHPSRVTLSALAPGSTKQSPRCATLSCRVRNRGASRRQVLVQSPRAACYMAQRESHTIGRAARNKPGRSARSKRASGCTCKVKQRSLLGAYSARVQQSWALLDTRRILAARPVRSRATARLATRRRRSPRRSLRRRLRRSLRRSSARLASACPSASQTRFCMSRRRRLLPPSRDRAPRRSSS